MHDTVAEHDAKMTARYQELQEEHRASAGALGDSTAALEEHRTRAEDGAVPSACPVPPSPDSESWP